jgi:hypothetical protein
MSKTTYPFAFQHPANILIVGPTRSGKTSFLECALRNHQFEPEPERITWVYSEMQNGYDELQQLAHTGQLGACQHIEFVKDDTDYEAMYESMDATKENMLVLDDQMTEAATGGKRALAALTKLFTKGSHHRRVTIVFILQNAFEKGLRSVSLQANYYVLTKNPRGDEQVARLAQSLSRNKMDFVVDAFNDATRSPFSHLLIDMCQDTPPELRYLTCVTEPVSYAYVPRDI